MILLQINVGCHFLFSSKLIIGINANLHGAESILLKPWTPPSLLPLSPQHIHSYLTLSGKNRNHTLLVSSAFLHSISHFLCILILLQLLPSLPLWRQVSATLLGEWRLILHGYPCYLSSRLLHIHQQVPHSRTISLSAISFLSSYWSKSLDAYSISHNPMNPSQLLYIRLWLKEFWHTKGNQVNRFITKAV